MDRRQFIATGALASLGASMGSIGHGATPENGTSTASGDDIPAVLGSYTAEDHRRRLENIGHCQRGVRKCMREHLITDYLAGQCVYNLGEYPCRKPWDPDDWDEQELDRLYDQGIRLIQLHEEWNDALRLFGGHKFAPLNPAGFRRFIDMVHRRGMKIIVYASSGFFQRTDPDFRPEWTGNNLRAMREIYFTYVFCSAASPGWRNYYLKHVVRILDEYGVDGIYNDLGYRQPPDLSGKAKGDWVLAFEENPEHDGALGDMLGLVYAEVKRRGGIVKIHRSGNKCTHTAEKIYDYLWVGEGGRRGDQLRLAVKNHLPYVAPCLDMSRAQIANEDELYLHTIPYMQFPVLLAGRPFTGERATIPGVEYPPENRCFWTRHCRAIWKCYQANPDGPHSYGWWDSVPGRPEARPTHAHWLNLYAPLVEEGTRAWLEIGDSDLVTQPLPADVVVSAFANRDLYMVLANYGPDRAVVQTADRYQSVVDKDGQPNTHWNLASRSLQILRRVG